MLPAFGSCVGTNSGVGINIAVTSITIWEHQPHLCAGARAEIHAAPILRL